MCLKFSVKFSACTPGDLTHQKIMKAGSVLTLAK